MRKTFFLCLTHLVQLVDVQIDPLKSPENWTFTFGEPTVTSNSMYFAINRIFLFKGLVQIEEIFTGDIYNSSENFNDKCSLELVGGEHMICLQCQDDIYALLPDKLACVPNSFGLITGPSKGGNLHPNLKVFCPEGHAYLPLTVGGSCLPCTNPDCSRCFREDLSKCLGCKTLTFLRKDDNDLCVPTVCAANQYLTAADGNKCVDFVLPGCNQMDQYGWCSKIAGQGCTSGQSYAAGICCVNPPSKINISTYPATCIQCHDTCQTCSGTASNQCLTCPSFHRLRKNGTSCLPCTPVNCLKCDSSPTVCEATYAPVACGADKCLPGKCKASGYECNFDGCMAGYTFSPTPVDRLCHICNRGANDCLYNNSSRGSTCRSNYVLQGAAPNTCSCNAPFAVQVHLIPNPCILCQANCSACSAPNICILCRSEFKLTSPTCTCQITNGFREISGTVCTACTKGCSECSSDINVCSGTVCRTNYVNFPNCTCPVNEGYVEQISTITGEPRTCVTCTAGVGCHQCALDRNTCSGCRANYTLVANGCSCSASGFRLNTVTTPQSCEPCDVLNCHSCSSNKSQCDVGGCRINFTRADPTTCSCIASGFRLNMTTNPYSCEPCDVQNCHNCSSDKTQCEVNGCRANFTQVNATTCSCNASGFRLNTTTTPHTCEPCDVQNCHDCSTDKTQCEVGGCRPNFTRVNATTCSCNAIGFQLNTSTSPHTCELAPLCTVPNCQSCSVDINQCDLNGCRSNFTRVNATTCSCSASGFRLNTTTSPQSCEPCDVLNCHSCSTIKTQCEVGGCRTNFIRDSPTSCSCSASGFRLNTGTSPQTCELCDVQNCHSCSSSKTECDVGGCRANFTRASPTTCSCTSVGFGLNAAVSPFTCEPCDVQNCLNCSSNKTQCELGGCRPNFTRVNATTCSCNASGFRLNTTTTPHTCEPCDVENCHDCSTDKTQCELGGCRPNFTRVDSTTCSCTGSSL